MHPLHLHPILRMTTLPGQPPMTLPPFISYQSGELVMEGVSLKKLSEQHGTPLFVYSRAAMLGAVAQAWPTDGPASAARPAAPFLGLAWPEGAPC